jgi:hypothetical protein
LRRLVGWPVVALVAVGLLTATLRPSTLSAAQLGSAQLAADLDGKTIALAEVGNWYCHDFSWPKIHCFSTGPQLELAVASFTSTSSITYMTVYDYTTYQGPYMYFSQDYTVLATIGWNDRVSSFIVHNSQSGVFWTDWFYTGTRFTWCCNQGWASLGSYDNVFSSIYRS